MQPGRERLPQIQRCNKRKIPIVCVRIAIDDQGFWVRTSVAPVYRAVGRFARSEGIFSVEGIPVVVQIIFQLQLIHTVG